MRTAAISFVLALGTETTSFPARNGERANVLVWCHGASRHSLIDSSALSSWAFLVEPINPASLVDRGSSRDLGQCFQVLRSSEWLSNIGDGGELRSGTVPGERDHGGNVRERRQGIECRTCSLDASSRRFTGRHRLILSGDGDIWDRKAGGGGTRLDDGQDVSDNFVSREEGQCGLVGRV